MPIEYMQKVWRGVGEDGYTPVSGLGFHMRADASLEVTGRLVHPRRVADQHVHPDVHDYLLSAFPGGQASAPGGAAASAIGAAVGSDAL